MTVSEVALANFMLPFASMSITESCKTSLNIENCGMSGLAPIAPKTAFAMLPTPLCMGKNSCGIRPAFISEARKFATFSPTFVVMGSAGLKPPTSSGRSVSTMPTILDGSIFTVFEPILSEQV